MAFYIESADRPHTSRVVAEDIDVGELGADNGSNKAVAFDQASHAEEDFLGVADNHRSGTHIVEDEGDAGGDTFESSEDDRASFGGDADRDVIKVKTAEDNGTDPAPSISEGTVVGVIDSSAVSGTAAEFQGRIVEEGYTDNAALTFDRTSGNFYAVGVAHRDESSSFDDVVRVQVRKDLN